MKFVLFLSVLFFSEGVWARAVQAQKVIVSGPSEHLVSVVKEIHQAGGNIFDSAVAGAFTLSVTHPYFVSLGCGGFALLRERSGGVKALDFREVAPVAMKENFYTKGGFSPRRGGTAVGVPGFVAGMWELHKKHGVLPWSRVLVPAIKLADQGFLVSGQWLRKTKDRAGDFNLHGRRVFYHSDGKPYLPGETLRQKKLKKALKLIQRRDKWVFYKGVIGQDVVRTVQAEKGVLSVKDLHSYRVRWLKPFEFRFKDYQIFSMPLPSSGGIIMARAGRLMEQTKVYKQKLYSVHEWHLLGEILSLAFRPRVQMGDLVDSDLDSYLKGWLSQKRLTRLGSQISLGKVKTLPVLKSVFSEGKGGSKKPGKAQKSLNLRKEAEQTTHFSVMNKKGEVVSMTLTLNGNFGSFVVTDKYGIALNNQMDDFNTRPGQPNQFGLIQGGNNKVRAGRRPLSSMSPTIVVQKGGKRVMAVGGAGGPMIISSVLQTWYRYLVRSLDLDRALQGPRVHHQFLPRVLFVEKDRFSPVVLNLLRKRGHKIKERASIAKVYAVSMEEDGLLRGAFDARGEGASGGL